MTSYIKFVRTTGYVDLGLFMVLALPFLSTYLMGQLFELGLYLGDMRQVPDMSSSFIQLAVNLIGILGVFNAWLRVSASHTQVLCTIGPAVGVMKICAALAFGFWAFLGAPLVLLVLLMADLCIGCLLLFRRKQ